MDIGHKLQNARMGANFTQEKAAEALGVSRQTISNWENEKTYPDIRSVVKMSDLYAISLDCLLKGEESMGNYLNYLEESTNVVNSKKQLSKLILVITYFAIWTLSIIVFWFFTSGSDAMGYGLIYLWLLLPITTFSISILIGKNNYWGNYKWLSALIFGIMYMLAEYATFSAANMVTSGKVSSPEFMLILHGAIISLAGLGIGEIVKNHRDK